MSDKLIKRLTEPTMHKYIVGKVGVNGFALLIALGRHQNGNNHFELSNDSLMDFVKANTSAGLIKIRSKCVKEGLLVYSTGNPNKPGKYLITI